MAQPPTYSHGVIVPGGADCVLVSGQIGIDEHGNVGGTFEHQAELACRNLLKVLEGAQMSAANIAKTTVFLTSADHISAWRTVRARVLGGIAPASTLVIVSALVDPRLQIEVEGIAVANR
jgi:enamine deaminase RidA (YjgF/YER057c/UK114 family)